MMPCPFADTLEAMSVPLEDATITQLDLLIKRVQNMMYLAHESATQKRAELKAELKVLRERRRVVAAKVADFETTSDTTRASDGLQQSTQNLETPNSGTNQHPEPQHHAPRVEDKAKDRIFVPCKRRREQRHTPSLHIEIITNILLRLPADLLHEVVRFVCKQWYAVVADPVFVKAHSQSSSAGLIFQEPSKLHHFNYIEGGTGELKPKEIKLPFPARLLGSFNGIVLLEDLKDPLCCTHLMNPVTKEIISLPPVGWNSTYGSTGVAITSSGHYKVVHVFSAFGLGFGNVQMRVFTIGVDKDWRSIDVQGRNMSSAVKQSLMVPPHFIAGMIYWPGRPTYSGIALDVNNETIYEFSGRPDFFEHYTRRNYYLSMGTGLGLAKKEGDIWQLWELTGVKTDEWTHVAGINMGLVSKRVERMFSPLMFRALWPISFINGEIWFYSYVHVSLAETFIEKFPVVRYNLADESVAFFLVEELSQKASIAELKTQLDEERDQRKEEREKAAADLKASIQRVQSEAQEELKRASDVALLREREQQEVINKLQESERENSSLAESLRFKLEETRQKLVLSDNKIRQLEAQTSEQQQACDSTRKRVDELEAQMRMMGRELDKQKAAREEAWAKVSALELEINAAMRDLECERRRLKGAREKIMLRETQLRAFYSTTEEIKMLFSKQQEQLKAMQRTLEDEENYGNATFGFSLNAVSGNVDGDAAGDMQATVYKSKAGPTASAQRFDRCGVETSCDEGSATEKHECEVRSQDDEHTQEAQFPNDDCPVKCGFGSDIDGVGTAPICEGDADGTERVLDTESPGVDGERNTGLIKSGNLAGDTFALEYDTNAQETEPEVLRRCDPNRSQMTNREEAENAIDDAEPKPIRTEDLLASEVAGSWAIDTNPSVYGDNESPQNDAREAVAATQDSGAQVAESHSSALATRIHSNVERQALGNFIGILAPDVKDQFGNAVGMGCREKKTEVEDSETEEGEFIEEGEFVEASKDDARDGASESDDETQADKSDDNGDAMDEDDDDTQEDSVG